MPHRILVFGERGQLAGALAGVHAARGDRVVTAGRSTIDIGDGAAVRSAILDFRPDVVVNAAAYTDVDRAEDDAGQAYRVNCEGARHAAAGARAAGAMLIHISTDYVFDGTRSAPYVESDATNPLGVYGQSKLAGERAVAAEGAECIVLRTSWLYSEAGRNFVTAMVRLASERREVSVVNDRWGAPTYASDLAAAVAKICDTVLSRSDRGALCGIYHAAGPSMMNWHQFAQAIMDVSAARGGASCEVRAIPSSEYAARASRPQNSQLDSSKLASVFGIRLPPMRSSLELCMDRLLRRQGAVA